MSNEFRNDEELIATMDKLIKTKGMEKILNAMIHILDGNLVYGERYIKNLHMNLNTTLAAYLKRYDGYDDKDTK